MTMCLEPVSVTRVGEEHCKLHCIYELIFHRVIATKRVKENLS